MSQVNGHIIAGLTPLWKRIQLLQEIMLLLIMVFAISALPVLTVPGWLTGISRVFPVTPAVVSLRGVMLGHRGVTGHMGEPAAWSESPSTSPRRPSSLGACLAVKTS